VSQPLSETRMMEVLEEYFATRPYITVRAFATLCQCSNSTADRRIKELVAQGKLRRSDISARMYERVMSCEL
jgi:Fic family protein